MAFATQNLKRGYFGNLKVLYGNWTGSVGDAAGSVVVEGGQVYLANFIALLPNQTSYNPAIQINQSVSGNVQTITVNNVETVASGQFIIIYA